MRFTTKKRKKILKYATELRKLVTLTASHGISSSVRLLLQTYNDKPQKYCPLQFLLSFLTAHEPVK